MINAYMKYTSCAAGVFLAYLREIREVIDQYSNGFSA